MECPVLWDLIEATSNLFYDPLLFWGLPLVVVLVYEWLRAKQSLPRANPVAAFADNSRVQLGVRIAFGAEYQHPCMLIEVEPSRRFAIVAQSHESSQARDAGFATHHGRIATLPRRQAAHGVKRRIVIKAHEVVRPHRQQWPRDQRRLAAR
jgi:hypothetical protein